MVIIKNFKYFILFFSFFYPSLNMSEGFLNSLWQRCTLKNAITAFNVGIHALQLSEFVQLTTYTNWDGKPKNYDEKVKEVSKGVENNIKRIADELKIDISDLKIKKMTNGKKCIMSLGIEATRNFIFVEEEVELFRSEDPDIRSYDFTASLFDFSNKDDVVVTFLIRQALLKWQQAFYTKRIIHTMARSLLQSMAVSTIHSLCKNSISSIFNPSFNNTWAQWSLDQGKYLANIGLYLSLFKISSYCIGKWKSRIGGSVYYDIVQKAADFQSSDSQSPTFTYVQEGLIEKSGSAYYDVVQKAADFKSSDPDEAPMIISVREKLMEERDACEKVQDCRFILIQKQLSVLEQITNDQIASNM